MEKCVEILFMMAALVCIIAVAVICFFLFKNGIPAMAEIGFFDFVFGMKWKPGNELFGIFPMIIGSVIVTALSILMGVPIGIFGAIFMVFYCPEKIYKMLKPLIDLLAGIPSIVYGFFGLVVIVPLMQSWFGGSGKSVLTASILLGIMILPTIIILT